MYVIGVGVVYEHASTINCTVSLQSKKEEKPEKKAEAEKKDEEEGSKAEEKKKETAQGQKEESKKGETESGKSEEKKEEEEQKTGGREQEVEGQTKETTQKETEEPKQGQTEEQSRGQTEETIQQEEEATEQQAEEVGQRIESEPEPGTVAGTDDEPSRRGSIRLPPIGGATGPAPENVVMEGMEGQSGINQGTVVPCDLKSHHLKFPCVLRQPISDSTSYSPYTVSGFKTTFK